ncbi:MAG: GNAT family N-acetyltransferase [Alphaproteobacteria bacterium]
MPVNSSVAIRELTAEEMPLLYPLVKQLNEGLSQQDFDRFIANMLEHGYRCAGAWQGDKLVGAVGFWTHTRFWAGMFLEVDNVVVDKDARDMGIGASLSRWVDNEAVRMGASRVMAAVYTSNTAAQRFYVREGYSILGFYFTKKLG